MNIRYVDLEKQLKEGKLNSVYLFCGIDIKLIKDIVDKIKSLVLKDNFMEFNYIKMEGNKIESADTIINACETLPFMSERKIVEVYNFDFLKKEKEKSEDKIFKSKLKDYLKNIPPHSILIMYYIFDNSREKPSNYFNKLSSIKEVCACKVDKLRGLELQKRVKVFFDKRDKKIERSDLSYFCSIVDNNMNVIENEVDKLCAFTEGRDIQKKDIEDIMPQRKENDIFNLVDALSSLKIKDALDVLNELIYRGEAIPMIISMIERQFNLILRIKLGIEDGFDKDGLVRKLKLNPYVCDNLIKQSGKFKKERLKKILDLCLESEERIKSSSVDKKVEIELLITSIMVI
ncbi:DNA polymerase III subunit delta [Haloimpatiens sp. FM7315]|uniref:DNA polymerase III subunit delta n=1 Tax=Haloimpatiens sp. FM7315 TaxID=3298609 RepID=UPI00370A4FB8